eukprot:TRINITY_DN12391_c1_g1_i3.p2 TRINITY_DN12391_c1_g1~~TRINITY_DN12391_c1_g1_i3.p2  ORF type:complete len:260 (+),score=30.94 TRINITY_DN12391_c1_g1_i3:2-781(+)
MLAVVAGIAIGLYSITLFSSSAPPIGSKANPAVAKLHPDDSARVVSIQSQLTALQKDRHAADTSLTDQIDDNSKMLAQAIDQLRESQTALDVEDRFDKISKELDMLKNKSAKSGNEFANMTKQIKALAGTIASQLTNSSIQMEKSQANLPEQMKEMQEKINKILQRSEELDDATSLNTCVFLKIERCSCLCLRVAAPTIGIAELHACWQISAVRRQHQHYSASTVRATRASVGCYHAAWNECNSQRPWSLDSHPSLWQS